MATTGRRKTFVPVKDFALKHHISVQAVYKAINAGRLKMRKIGTYTLVLDTDP